MAEIIYGLCALTSVLCTWLLLRAYYTQRIALLLWCGLFFAVQTLLNAFLIVDKLILPDSDLGVYRFCIGFVAICILLYGLIMRTEVD
ncbi:MAG: DUF5985 family protein [Nitrospiraceae bacterium]